MITATRHNPGVGATYRDSARATVPDGDAGTLQVIQKMRAFVEDAARTPLVQRAASMIVANAGSNQLAQVQALHSFLRAAIVFKPDTIGAETLRHPEQLLSEIETNGRAAADCDDVAMLAGAIMRAMGIRPVFFLVARQPGPFEHVHPGARIGARVIPFDPQENVPPGSLTPGVRRIFVDA